MEIGDKVIDFTIPDQDGRDISLSQYKGKWLILYFYPRDNTPGCTIEAIDFSTLKKEFKKLDAVILGVSPDTQKKHQNFIKKHDLGITLLSDTELKLIKGYGVWQLKKNYGKEYFGIVRTTFLIDKEGKIVYKWNKVKAKGHAQIVINKLTELLSES